MIREYARGNRLAAAQKWENGKVHYLSFSLRATGEMEDGNIFIKGGADYEYDRFDNTHYVGEVVVVFPPEARDEIAVLERPAQLLVGCIFNGTDGEPYVEPFIIYCYHPAAL